MSSTQTDWRGLCEELSDALAAHHPGHVDDQELIDRARAALSESYREPTLNNLSNWVTECSENPKENKWAERVDPHDSLAVAKAVLYDWEYLVK